LLNLSLHNNFIKIFHKLEKNLKPLTFMLSCFSLDFDRRRSKSDCITTHNFIRILKKFTSYETIYKKYLSKRTT